MSQYQNVIILGDFNLPDIDWPCLTSHSPFSDSLCDFVFEFNLTQLILNSTDSKGNILDLLFTDIDHIISNLHITPSSRHLLSDHFFISLISNPTIFLLNVPLLISWTFPRATTMLSMIIYWKFTTVSAPLWTLTLPGTI